MKTKPKPLVDQNFVSHNEKKEMDKIRGVFQPLRNLVSQDKNRYKDANFDLDLTYITKQVIAMSLPASGVERTYRYVRGGEKSVI